MMSEAYEDPDLDDVTAALSPGVCVCVEVCVCAESHRQK